MQSGDAAGVTPLSSCAGLTRVSTSFARPTQDADGRDKPTTVRFKVSSQPHGGTAEKYTTFDPPGCVGRATNNRTCSTGQPWDKPGQDEGCRSYSGLNDSGTR